MQYQVPQFLEIEDKIIGPFSIRQFLYMVGGVGGVYLAFRILPVILAIIPSLLIGGLGAALAFYRPNNKPFVNFLEAMVKFLLNTRLYVWRQTVEKEKTDELSLSSFSRTHHHRGIAPKPVESKLQNLAWQIDVQDSGAVETQRVRSM